MVNQLLATHALALLTRLFRHGTIEHHGAFVSALDCRSQPIPIDAAIWERFRRSRRRSAC